MRVTGGALGGRRLRAPARGPVRPTADRVREALFARLGGLAGARVLDLYAGSGALGIEALSRGAVSAHFVERAAPVLQVLRANLEALALAQAARVLRGDACSVVRRLARDGTQFDLVLVDPPYASSEASRALRALAESGILAPGAVVVVESSRHQPLALEAGYRRMHEKRYGDTVVALLTADPEGGEPPGGQEPG